MGSVTRPPYGSVESYARILRRGKREFLESTAPGDEALLKVVRVKNLLAAVELVDLEPVADPTGLVSGARVEPHVGAGTEAGLVDETEERCVASLHIPTPGESCLVCGAEGMRHGEHLEVMAESGADGMSAQCACGTKVEGFDTFAEAHAELAIHIRDARAATARHFLGLEESAKYYPAKPVSESR